MVRRIRASFTAALLLQALLVLSGCSNPFQQFYTGITAAQANATSMAVKVPSAPASVWAPADMQSAIESRLQDGKMMLGSSAWVGANVGSESEARAHAKTIGASEVLWNYSYLSSSSGVMPITTPTTTTTYGSGTVYGGYGTANWSGSATTYGTTTSYVPYTVHRYSVQAAFLADRARPPVFGVHTRLSTLAEQSSFATTEGIVVLLVIRNTPASRAGVVPGDLIVRVDNRTVSTPEAYSSLMEELAGRQVSIELRRGSETKNLTVQLNP